MTRHRTRHGDASPQIHYKGARPDPSVLALAGILVALLVLAGSSGCAHRRGHGTAPERMPRVQETEHVYYVGYPMEAELYDMDFCYEAELLGRDVPCCR